MFSSSSHELMSVFTGSREFALKCKTSHGVKTVANITLGVSYAQIRDCRRSNNFWQILCTLFIHDFSNICFAQENNSDEQCEFQRWYWQRLAACGIKIALQFPQESFVFTSGCTHYGNIRLRMNAYAFVYEAKLDENSLNPSPPPPPHRHFVTSPQSPICHQFKMASVNTFHRFDWDRQLRRLGWKSKRISFWLRWRKPTRQPWHWISNLQIYSGCLFKQWRVNSHAFQLSSRVPRTLWVTCFSFLRRIVRDAVHFPRSACPYLDLSVLRSDLDASSGMASTLQQLASCSQWQPSVDEHLGECLHSLAEPTRVCNTRSYEDHNPGQKCVGHSCRMSYLDHLFLLLRPNPMAHAILLVWKVLHGPSTIRNSA